MTKVSLDQKTLDRAHKSLDWLIETAEDARIQACNKGETQLRDKLGRVCGYLHFARAEAGSLDFGGGIRPLSGGK